MTVTTLDPKTALVVIDLQKGIVAMPVVHPAKTVLAHTRQLADAFRRKGLPVVLVNVDAVAPGRTEAGRTLGDLPADWTEFAPELGRQPKDIVVTKKTRGAFASTDLEDRLKSLGVTQVVMTGISTSAGVESTARHAHDLGFNVTFATDAMTDRDSVMHEHSVTRIFPGIGETGTTQEILALLDAANA